MIRVNVINRDFNQRRLGKCNRGDLISDEEVEDEQSPSTDK